MSKATIEDIRRDSPLQPGTRVRFGPRCEGTFVNFAHYGLGGGPVALVELDEEVGFGRHQGRYAFLDLRNKSASWGESETVALYIVDVPTREVGDLIFCDPPDYVDPDARYEIVARIQDRNQLDSAWAEYQRHAGAFPAEARIRLPAWLIEARRWSDLETLLTDLLYLESRTEACEIVHLINDFQAASAALPADRPMSRVFPHLAKALSLDAAFIARHAREYPQGLFQCLWNRCWSDDAVEAARYDDPPPSGWPGQSPPGGQEGPKLCQLLRKWRAEREQRAPGFSWVRSLLPPQRPLGGLAVTNRWDRVDVRDICFAPDESRLAISAGDHTIRLCDLDTGAELAVCRGHEDGSDCVAFSSDGRWIASGSCDNTVRLWDAQSGAELGIFRGHEHPVISVAFSADGRRIASGSMDNTVRLWDVASGAHVATFLHREWVRSVAISPDGSRIAGGGAHFDPRVFVWDVESGAEVTAFSAHTKEVKRVLFSLDGRRIISASESEEFVWDATTAAELAHRDDGELAVGRHLYGWLTSSQPESAEAYEDRYLVKPVMYDHRLTYTRTVNERERVWGPQDRDLCPDPAKRFPSFSGRDNSSRYLEIAFEQAPFDVQRGFAELDDGFVGRIVAWYPIPLIDLFATRSWRIWAAADENALHLLALEGSAASQQ